MSADTSPEIAERYSKMLMALPPARRVAMCFDMSDTARSLVRKSLESAGVGPEEIAPALAHRLYGSSVSLELLARYVEHRRNLARARATPGLP